MYVELHCHSYFSLLDGVSSPEALVARAAELGMPALALTDHDAFYGVVAFWRAARAAGIKPIFGVEITLAVEDQTTGRAEGKSAQRSRQRANVPTCQVAARVLAMTGEQEPSPPDTTHLTLLAENETGYANLSQLITAARFRAKQLGLMKGEARATWEDLSVYHRGVIALSGCRQGEIAQQLVQGCPEEAVRTACRLRELFGPQNFLVEIQQQGRPGDEWLAQRLTALAAKHKFPVVATNDVHYAIRPSHRLHDVLVAVRNLSTLDDCHHQRRGNSEAYLKGHAELAPLFARLRGGSDALARAQEVAGRCHVELRYGVQALPIFPVPQMFSEEALDGFHGAARVSARTGDARQQAYLRWLCECSLVKCYGGEPGEQARRMLAHELAVIGQLGLANYFLIVWDIMRFAREQGIRCQGRGSAANSLVAYLLGITPIDPLAHDLVFERFLSIERPTLPDIDIDFDAMRREEVIQYVYQRYGREHAAMACTLVTFRQRSAVRDVGRALELPPELIDLVATAADRISLDEALGEVLESWKMGDSPKTQQRSGVPAADQADLRRSGTGDDAAHRSDGAHRSDALRPAASPATWQMLLRLCQEIRGLPRHLGIHNGGMVLSGTPLARVMPLEPAAMPDRTVCQWDKEALEDAGLVKIDLLGLRMLAALEEALDVVEEVTGQRPATADGRFDDPAVYDLICSGDTIGCFQVESRAQAQLIPHFQPRCFNDLIIEISLIRPGPIQGNMVQPYLRRRQGKEPVTYAHPLLEPALGETLGVIVFQEQVVKVARDLAGFTGGQGEQLRRALGRKDGDAEMERLRVGFVAGAVAKGVPAAIAQEIFDQLKAFGGYAFAKSHAASFAVIVYQSAWLKRYHPVAFYIGLLRCQPMGFYSPAVLINDARRHGIPVLPVDVNRSGVRYEAESGPWTVTVLPEHNQNLGLRIGLSTIKGLGEAGAERIVLARLRAEQETGCAFRSLLDFCRRTRLPRAMVEQLILAGALDGLQDTLLQESGAALDAGPNQAQPPKLPTRRRELLWRLGLLDYEQDTLLHQQPGSSGRKEGFDEVWNVPAELPPLRPLEALAAELMVMGVSAGDHVMTHHRARLKERGILSSQELVRCQGGELVWVAGQVTVLQSPPTAKGFWFLTLEDEFGMINIIIRPDIALRYRRIWRRSPLIAVLGRVQREGAAINLLAQRPWRLVATSED